MAGKTQLCTGDKISVFLQTHRAFLLFGCWSPFIFCCKVNKTKSLLPGEKAQITFFFQESPRFGQLLKFISFTPSHCLYLLLNIRPHLKLHYSFACNSSKGDRKRDLFRFTIFSIPRAISGSQPMIVSMCWMSGYRCYLGSFPALAWPTWGMDNA